MRELPFGARFSDSFVEMLKQTAAKATAEWPGALPRLFLEEKREHRTPSRREPTGKRIDFDHELEAVQINRLASSGGRCIVVTERLWALCFDKIEWAPEMTFDLGGVKLHIDQQAQTELKGATLEFLNNRIIATYETI